MNRIFCILLSSLLLTFNAALAMNTNETTKYLQENGYAIVDISDYFYIMGEKNGKRTVYFVDEFKNTKLIVNDNEYDSIKENYYGKFFFTVKNGKYGFYFKDKKITENIYDEIDYCTENGSNYIIAKYGSKIDIFDLVAGNKILSGGFDEIEFDDGYIIVKKNGKKGLIKSYFDEKEIIFTLNTVYDEIYFQDGYLITKKDNKYNAYYDMKKAPDINADEIIDENGYSSYLVYKRNGKFGALFQNKASAEPIYDSLKPFGNFLITKKNDKFGAYFQNKKILESTYSKTDVKAAENLYYYKDNKVGIYNNDFHFAPLDNYEIIQDNPFILKKGNKYAIYSNYDLIGETNKKMPEFIYDKIEQVDDYRYKLYKDSKLGLYNIFPAIYDNFYYTDDEKNMIITESGNKKGAYSYFGNKKEQIPVLYDDIECHKEYCIVTLNGKKGIYGDANYYDVTEKYNILIPVEFDDVKTTNGRDVIVTKGDKKGVYLNKKLIAPVEFYDIKFLSTDYFELSKIKDSYIFAIADEQLKKMAIFAGKEQISPYEYDDIDMGLAQFIVKKGDKSGVVEYKRNKEGKILKRIVVPIKFDEIKSAYNSYIVKNNDKYGLYHIEKGMLLKIKYKNIEKDQNDAQSVIATTNYRKITRKVPLTKEQKYEEEAAHMLGALLFDDMHFTVKERIKIFMIKHFMKDEAED